MIRRAGALSRSGLRRPMGSGGVRAETPVVRLTPQQQIRFAMMQQLHLISMDQLTAFARMAVDESMDRILARNNMTLRDLDQLAQSAAEADEDSRKKGKR